MSQNVRVRLYEQDGTPVAQRTVPVSTILDAHTLSYEGHHYSYSGLEPNEGSMVVLRFTRCGYPVAIDSYPV